MTTTNVHMYLYLPIAIFPRHASFCFGWDSLRPFLSLKSQENVHCLLLTNEMPLSLSEVKVRIGKTIWLRNERLKDVRTQNKVKYKIDDLNLLLSIRFLCSIFQLRFKKSDYKKYLAETFTLGTKT